MRISDFIGQQDSQEEEDDEEEKEDDYYNQNQQYQANPRQIQGIHEAVQKLSQKQNSLLEARKSLFNNLSTIMRVRKQYKKQTTTLNKINLKGKQVQFENENEQNEQVKKKNQVSQFLRRGKGQMGLGTFLGGLGAINGENFDFNNEADMSVLTSALQKPHNQRKKKQNTLIQEALKQTKFYEFYESIFSKHPNIYQAIVGAFQFRTYKKYEYIQHQGDFASEIIIFLRGKASILVPNLEVQYDELEKNLEMVDKLTEIQNLIGGSQRQIEQHLERQQFKSLEQYIETINPGFKVVKMAEALDYFGDAFVRNKSRNKFTLQCMENSEVVVLTNLSYNNIMPPLTQLEIFDKCQYWISTGSFKGLQKQDIETLLRISPIENFCLGNSIYKQNENPEGFYLILEGNVELVKNIQASVNHDNFDNVNEYLKKQREASQFQKNNKSNQQQNLRRTIALICEGQSFGEDELIQNIPRQYSAICKSSICKLIKVDRQLYINLMFQNFESHNNLLTYKENQSITQKWRKKLIVQIDKVQQNIIDQYEKDTQLQLKLDNLPQKKENIIYQQNNQLLQSSPQNNKNQLQLDTQSIQQQSQWQLSTNRLLTSQPQTARDYGNSNKSISKNNLYFNTPGSCQKLDGNKTDMFFPSFNKQQQKQNNYKNKSIDNQQQKFNINQQESMQGTFNNLNGSMENDLQYNNNDNLLQQQNQLHQQLNQNEENINQVQKQLAELKDNLLKNQDSYNNFLLKQKETNQKQLLSKNKDIIGLDIDREKHFGQQFLKLQRLKQKHKEVNQDKVIIEKDQKIYDFQIRKAIKDQSHTFDKQVFRVKSGIDNLYEKNQVFDKKQLQKQQQMVQLKQQELNNMTELSQYNSNKTTQNSPRKIQSQKLPIKVTKINLLNTQDQLDDEYEEYFNKNNVSNIRRLKLLNQEKRTTLDDVYSSPTNLTTSHSVKSPQHTFRKYVKNYNQKNQQQQIKDDSDYYQNQKQLGKKLVNNQTNTPKNFHHKRVYNTKNSALKNQRDPIMQGDIKGTTSPSDSLIDEEEFGENNKISNFSPSPRNFQYFERKMQYQRNLSKNEQFILKRCVTGMEQEMAKHEEFANFIVKSSQDAPKYLKDSNSGNSTTKNSRLQLRKRLDFKNKLYSKTLQIKTNENKPVILKNKAI